MLGNVPLAEGLSLLGGQLSLPLDDLCLVHYLTIMLVTLGLHRSPWLFSPPCHLRTYELGT